MYIFPQPTFGRATTFVCLGQLVPTHLGQSVALGHFLVRDVIVRARPRIQSAQT